MTRPDPSIRLLPNDRLFVVCLSATRAARWSKLGGLKICRCFDCGAQLAVDLKTERRAFDHPLRDGRPVDYVGKQCCLPKYHVSKN